MRSPPSGCRYNLSLAWTSISCERLASRRRTQYLARISLNLQIYAGDLCSALPLMAPRTLAKLGEPYVSALAQFQSRSNEYAVNINTSLSLKLEQHIHQARIIRSPAQYPSSAPENRAS